MFRYGGLARARAPTNYDGHAHHIAVAIGCYDSPFFVSSFCHPWMPTNFISITLYYREIGLFWQQEKRSWYMGNLKGVVGNFVKQMNTLLKLPI